MKFKISLTTTALLMMEMIFLSHFCTHLGETKALHLKNDGTEMVCTFFELKSPKALFDVSDFFLECKNLNNRRKWQTPSMVVEAENY